MALENEIFIGLNVRLYAVEDVSTITSATSPLTGAVDLGEVTTDGFKMKITKTTTPIETNNSGVVRNPVKDSEVTVGATLMEDTDIVDEFLSGKKVVNGVLADDGRSSYRGGLVADSIDDQLEDGTTRVTRFVYGNLQVTATEEFSVNNGTATQRAFTGTAYKSSKLGGAKYKKFKANLPASAEGN